MDMTLILWRRRGRLYIGKDILTYVDHSGAGDESHTAVLNIRAFHGHKLAHRVVPHQIRHIDIPVDLLRHIGLGDTCGNAHHNDITRTVPPNELGGQNRRGHHSHLALPGIHHPMFLAAPGEACLIIGLAVLRKGALCPLIHMANSGLLCVCGNDQCYGCMKITQCDPSC